MNNPEINDLIYELEDLLEQLGFRARDMGREPVLTPEEERRAFENYASARGKKKVELRNDIVKKNMKLVASISNKWAVRATKATGIEVDSLFQEGILGLIKAIDRYSLKRGLRFSTIATPYVEGAIRDFLKKPFKASKYEEPEEHEAPGEEGAEIISKIDRFLSQRSQSPEEKILGKISVRQLMRKLDPKEAQAIKLRYIDGLTLDKAGRIMKLSKERVSQYEKRALKKMRGMR